MRSGIRSRGWCREVRCAISGRWGGPRRGVPGVRAAIAEPVAEALARAGVGALALVRPTLGDDATLLVDACRDELVVGLERLGDVSVCEVHDPDPFERCGAGVPAAEIRFLAEVGVAYRVGALSSAVLRGGGYLRSGTGAQLSKVGRSCPAIVPGQSCPGRSPGDRAHPE